MLSGKPGVICLEGSEENTQEAWRTMKSWCWQKIHVVNTESKIFSEHSKDEMQVFYRFPDFRELYFFDGPEEGVDVKMSMSLFVKYLEEHKSQYITKVLFGFD